MEKLVEIWEKVLFYLSEFWTIASQLAAQAWEVIAPMAKSVWEFFLSVFCQLGGVCSDGAPTWMGWAVLAGAAVSIVVLVFSVMLLVRNS